MKTLIAVIASLGIASATFAGDFESIYVTHATASAVNFPAVRGQLLLKNLQVTSDKAGSLAKIYCRSGSGVKVSSANAAGTTILVPNVAAQFEANDLIAYQHADGTVDYTTVASTNTTVSIVLNDAISQAGTDVDRVYELTQQGQFIVGATTLNYIGDAVYAAPNDSPMRILMDSTSAGNFTATVERNP